MKKILSIVLAALIVILSVTSVYATLPDIIYVSGDNYPESEHEYQNDLYCTWEYTYHTEADALYVTFSDKTSLNYFIEEFEEDDDYYSRFYYDYLIIDSVDFEEYDYYDNSYTMQELTGATIYVPGNKFRITLETDYQGTDYGFSIDRISHEPPENVSVIRYHYDNTDKPDFVETFTDEPAKIFEVGYYSDKPGYALCGWSTKPDGKVEYYCNDSIEECGVYDLYAVWTKLIIEPDEAFSFYNSEIGRTDPADSDYYMSAEHYIMMEKNLLKTFGLGPIPGIIAAAVLSTYPTWNFTGSCYGMAASVFLQYHGVADFLSISGAESMRRVRLTPEIISMVNYYQAQAASSYLCENIAPNPGTSYYAENLKNVYETIQSGKPVLLTYYKDDYLVTMGHSVTLTGAFEDSYGNKFVVGYDSNFSYVNGQCHYFRITPDYKTFYNCYDVPIVTDDISSYENVLVTGFNWTADYEQFTSFDINGEGDPMVWYKVFFKHIANWFSVICSSLF